MMKFQGMLYAKNIEQNVKWYLEFFEYDNINDARRIDWENLAIKDIRNIFLIEFDDFYASVFRKIIIIKSKKTEIVGLSTSYVSHYKAIQLDIQKCKDLGMNLDQTSLYLTLKNSLPANITNDLMKDDRATNKKIDTKEIESIFDLKNFFKFE